MASSALLRRSCRAHARACRCFVAFAVSLSRWRSHWGSHRPRRRPVARTASRPPLVRIGRCRTATAAMAAPRPRSARRWSAPAWLLSSRRATLQLRPCSRRQDSPPYPTRTAPDFRAFPNRLLPSPPSESEAGRLREGRHLLILSCGARENDPQRRPGGPNRPRARPAAQECDAHPLSARFGHNPRRTLTGPPCSSCCGGPHGDRRSDRTLPR